MKKIRIHFIILMMCLGAQAQAQIDWSKVNFEDEYKAKTKIPGSAAKSLQSNPVFINDYYLTQASLMKGVSHAGTIQKQGVTSVFAEAALVGVSPEALQALIEELYISFVADLKGIGLNVTNGDATMQSKYVLSKADKKNVMIGKTDGQYIYDKSPAIDMSGSDIKEQYIFRPKNNNVFTTFKIPGTFYQNLAAKEKINLISIGYIVRFAQFEGQNSGLSKNSLTTTAGLMITPVISLVNPKGSFAWITYDKNIYGNNDWSNGLIKTGSRDGSALGLSSSADYAIDANQEKYLNELKQLIIYLQKDIANQLKASFK
ncbi:hypothetical protein KFE94_17400 [bacterium SCSIO 12643]|nr:hypothetical protein KFE94_17400 [bacterium SCSIO 12643]